jgi:hypothetical protein
MLAQRSISHDHELGLAAFAADFLERLDERGQSVARIESAQEENDGNVGAQRRGAGDLMV